MVLKIIDFTLSMCIPVTVLMRECTCVFLRICVHMSFDEYAYVSVFISINIYICVRFHACANASLFQCMCVYVCISMYVCICLYFDVFACVIDGRCERTHVCLQNNSIKVSFERNERRKKEVFDSSPRHTVRFSSTFFAIEANRSE